MTKRAVACLGFLACTVLFLSASSVFGQVSPAEILNPKLKAVEQKYLPQLESLRRTIDETRFPFPFVLTRYVGSDSEKGLVDTRGLEFVNFQKRMLLKVSGHYNAAFNSEQLTQNQRADRTLQDVVVPILQLMRKQFSGDLDCDGIGFEIAYHTRATKQSYEYEGKEMMVVVFSVEDAFAFLTVAGNEARQAIINRSQVFADGKEFALALGARDPLDLDELGRGNSPDRPSPSSAAPGLGYSSQPPRDSPPVAPAAPPSPARADRREQSPPASSSAAPAVVAPASESVQAYADRLQAKFQSQLDALTKDSAENLHFVDYAPPSFAVYHAAVVLQVSLRNPQAFDKGASSIYKRAAQSLDLFLAPELKALLPKLPADPSISALDFSVLNRLGSEKDSSEAVEFICPMKAVNAFIRDEITSQDLANQSIVLVNGVRIALNLQLVE
ncbi:MAG: hypothetical protein WB995_06435 [Candidatus Acidiferrales bacterium]